MAVVRCQVDETDWPSIEDACAAVQRRWRCASIYSNLYAEAASQMGWAVKVISRKNNVIYVTPPSASGMVLTVSLWGSQSLSQICTFKNACQFSTYMPRKFEIHFINNGIDNRLEDNIIWKIREELVYVSPNVR